MYKATLLLSLLLCVALPSTAQQTVTYRVEYANVEKGRLTVEIKPSQPKLGATILVIPRAIPSGYDQHFYDRYVENVRAISAAGNSLPVERLDGPRWRIAETNFASVVYTVDLYRLERDITSAADTSKARPGYVGLLGYSVLGYLEGLENLPISLEVIAPPGWPVFSTLEPKLPAELTRTTAQARDYFELADSQIAMGPAVKIARIDSKTRLFVTSYSEVETDFDKRAQIFADAFRKVVDYFGSVPFDSYTAYFEILKPVSEQHEYGFSMEHLNSSTYFLGTDRAINANTTAQQIERDRFNFAHHVAHSWIPKRAYGTGYLPFTWELAPQIDTIWFNEGFARYIAIEALADVMPESEARSFRQRQLELLQQIIDGMPQFIRKMPLIELSRIASLMYSGDFRTGRTLFAKGALMAAELDNKIRLRSNGKKRLRDSMRFLVDWARKANRAFRTEELPGLIARPAGVKESEVQQIMQRWLSAADY